MKKKLTSVGGSLGVIIDKPIADLYKLSRNSAVQITPSSGGIVITISSDLSLSPSDEEVLGKAKSVNKRYKNMMKNLAK